MNLEQLKAAYPLPFTLDDQQEQDIEQALPHKKVLLDLPVGHGKTVISTYTVLGQEWPRVVVAMPPILTTSWARWINGLQKAGEAVIYEGTIKQRAKIEVEKYKWLMVSHGLFKNDFKVFVQYLRELENTGVIIDEAQAMKSEGSDLYKAVSFLAEEDRNIIMMSGTIMSNPGDAYSYIKIKSPEIYRDRAQFNRIHVEKMDRFKAVTEWRNLELLQTNLRVNCVHRDKSETKGKPPTRMWPIVYKLAPKHYALYQKLMEEQLLLLPDGGKIDATTAQRLYNYSQQIIVNLDYFSGDPDARSNVYDLIDTVIDEIGVHNKNNSKLIIWTWFKRTTESLTAYLQNYGAVSAYSGSDSKKALDRFENDDRCRIVVAQPGSMGAGTNPQYVCCEALAVETPTRTIPFVQMTGRIDRKGQKYPSHNRIAQAEGTVQQDMYQNLLKNDDLVSFVSQSKLSIRDMIYGKYL